MLFHTAVPADFHICIAAYHHPQSKQVPTDNLRSERAHTSDNGDNDLRRMVPKSSASGTVYSVSAQVTAVN